MTEEPNLVGTMLGSYRITGELSRGGMGAVYRAQHSVLERAVAVKLLRSDLSTNQELVTRFINEAKAASAIRHPGIIEVLDFGHADDGRAYLVMEFLEGQSLSHRIESRRRLSATETAHIARGIASALSAAHAKGIVHRDLKPDNVFLVADPDTETGERPKVLDFGIAKLSDAAVRFTQTGALMGTPLYMAPEQARAAGGIDQRADLYSLGCIMYEMLVGEPPFVAVGAGEIIALQLFSTPEKPSTRVEGIPPELERIVLRLLEKEPSDRFQTAAEVSHALATAFGHAGVEVTTPLPFARGTPPPRPTSAATLQRHAPSETAPDLSPTRVEPAKSKPLWLWALAVTFVIGAAVAFVILRDDKAAAPPVAEQPTPAATPPPAPSPAPAPAPTAAPAPSPITAPAPAEPVKQPVRVNRPKNRDQKGSASDPRHTKQGSPIEIDLD